MASSGVDGRRMTALRAGFVRALEGATGACGFEEFVACYSHVPAAHHDTMFDVYCQSVTQLRAMALADFESICSSGRIRATLNALDEACDARGVTDFGVDARASRPAPATVDPEDAARAARCAAKQAELERLHAEIAEVEKANAAELEALEKRRAAVAAAAVTLRTCSVVDADLEFAAHVAAARKVPLLAGTQ